MGTPEVPLEHAHETIEHHAEHSTEPWIMGVALTAAVLAAMAAITALCVEHYAEESMHELLESSDLWNESQAESIKEKELETQQMILEGQNKNLKPDSQKKLAQYPEAKEEHRKQADEKKHESEKHVNKHLPLSFGLTMYQVAIAIGAISVLTKRREFWYGSILLGVLATGFLGWGLVA
jgi:Domain of unknown function (DUF4337)